jgi:hypothetical protein
MKDRLRIPLVLTWAAVSGASFCAAVACSSSSPEAQYGDASVVDAKSDSKNPVDAPADAPRQDAPAADATKEDATKDDATIADATESDVTPVECMGIVDGAFVYFQDDAGECPDGDTPIVV